MKISACILTKDSTQVEEAIKSVYKTCHEIIVTDTGSSYEYLKWLQTLGEKIKVNHFDWNDNSADARNFQIAHATGDYILILDADEKLQGDITFLDERFSHFFLQIFNGSEGGLWAARLFKNNIGVTFKNKLHANILESVDEENGCNLSGINILHSGYNDPEIVRAKLEKSIRLLRSDTDKLKHYHLANCHFCLGQFKESLESALALLNINGVEDEYKIATSQLIYNIFDLHDMIDKTSRIPKINEIQIKYKEIQKCQYKQVI